LGEGLCEESGGVREEEGVVRVEDGAVEGVDRSEARGGVVVGIVLGEGRGDECSEVLVVVLLVNSLHHCVSLLAASHVHQGTILIPFCFPFLLLNFVFLLIVKP